MLQVSIGHCFFKNISFPERIPEFCHALCSSSSKMVFTFLLLGTYSSCSSILLLPPKLIRINHKIISFLQFFTFDRKYLFLQKSSFLVLVCSKNFIFFAKMINGHKNKEAYCYCCGNKIAVSQFLQTSHICMFTVSLLCSNPCQQTGGTDRISSSMSAWIVLIT